MVKYRINESIIKKAVKAIKNMFTSKPPSGNSPARPGMTDGDTTKRTPRNKPAALTPEEREKLRFNRSLQERPGLLPLPTKRRPRS
jgi:hypothetical protein